MAETNGRREQPKFLVDESIATVVVLHYADGTASSELHVAGPMQQEAAAVGDDAPRSREHARGEQHPATPSVSGSNPLAPAANGLGGAPAAVSDLPIRFEPIIRYAREMGWLAIRDPFTGQWHEVRVHDAPASWRSAAYTEKKRRRP